MKVIFIFNLAYKTPFFYELVDRLHDLGKEVIVYDFISSKKYFPETKQIQSLNPFFGAKFILKIRYVRRLFIPLINKIVIKKEFAEDDLVNIHYVHYDYVQYAKIIKIKCSKLIVTFWGSDFLRANNDTRIKFIPLLECCDKITMVEGIQKDFKNYYKGFDYKIRTSFFGLSQLDLIKNVDSSSIQKFKAKYNVRNDVIVITIGYNASPAQQHLILIDILNNLKAIMKNKIHVLIPLTYGGNREYLQKVIKKIAGINISYTVFEKFLEEKELAILKKISNLTLNIQLTDAFSGSLSEAIVANNIVLVGDWLPYDVYADWGVKIFRSSLEDYYFKLVDIIENYNNYSKLIEGNSDKVYNKLSWNTRLPEWERILN